MTTNPIPNQPQPLLPQTMQAPRQCSEQQLQNLKQGREKRMAEIESRKRSYEEALMSMPPVQEEYRNNTQFRNPPVNVGHSLSDFRPDEGIDYADTQPYWSKILHQDELLIHTLGRENRRLSDKLSFLEEQLKEEDADASVNFQRISVLCASAALASIAAYQYLNKCFHEPPAAPNNTTMVKPPVAPKLPSIFKTF